MLATLIADASFAIHSEHKSAGWCAYVVRDGSRRYYGGSFHAPMVNNVTAECGAIVNGVWSALKANHIQYGDRLIIQTDCMAAIHHLTNCYPESALANAKRRAHVQQIIELYATLGALLEVNGLTHEFRHVRGHTNAQNSRSFVQGQCDRIARRYMAIADNEARQSKGRKANGG